MLALVATDGKRHGRRRTAPPRMATARGSRSPISPPWSAPRPSRSDAIASLTCSRRWTREGAGRLACFNHDLPQPRCYDNPPGAPTWSDPFIVLPSRASVGAEATRVRCHDTSPRPRPRSVVRTVWPSGQKGRRTRNVEPQHGRDRSREPRGGESSAPTRRRGPVQQRGHDATVGDVVAVGGQAEGLRRGSRRRSVIDTREAKSVGPGVSIGRQGAAGVGGVPPRRRTVVVT